MALLLSGCGGFAGLADVTLPGGPNLGSDPIVVSIEVSDAVNLVTQASVKVDDVTVGTVRSIKRNGWKAEIVVAIRGDLHLPANTRAAIRQTGLLGEKFVDLTPPPDSEARGRLVDGSVIGIRSTGTALDVEQVLGALSLLLNGGGIDRIQTITTELGNALHGREPDVRNLFSRLQALTETLSVNRAAIDHALDGIDRLTTQTRRNNRVIDNALVRIGPAVRALADQRKLLTSMLQATSRLATVGSKTVVAVHHELVASLESLEPVLASLTEVGNELPKALRYALTFPFPDSAFSALKGDYMNVSVEAEISETDLMRLLGLSGRLGSPASPIPSSTSDPKPPLLNSLLGSLGLLTSTNSQAESSQ
ncbi:MAG: MCE family protein [Marmoricola sp.]